MAIQNLKVYEEFVDFITSAPSPDQIAEYYMSSESQARVSELLEANQNRRLTDAESAELDDYQEVGRIIRRTKILAHAKLAKGKHSLL
ncbi:MAG: hypothetical protein ACYDBJ_19945 [Aggregatilineales bacterium]